MINKFKSPNSWSIVLKHKEDKDTRAIWKEVDDRNSTSMANELNQNQLLQYLSTIRLKGSPPWEKVPQNKFLLHFDERLRLWNEHSDDPFSDGMRLLQQAILGVPNLDKGLHDAHFSDQVR